MSTLYPVICDSEVLVQWNLSYPGSVGPRGARNLGLWMLGQSISRIARIFPAEGRITSREPVKRCVSV